MKSIRYLAIEFFILFILLPIFLTIQIGVFLKIILVAIGFVYIIFLLLKNKQVKWKIKQGIQWSLFWKRLALTFLLVIITTTIYVWIIAPKALFYVPIHNPKLFIFILFVYTVFSVWPQEIIYRTFFLKRYATLFTNNKLLIFINAIVFSLAHLFFRNTLVLVLTFIGGVLFGITYLKFKSTTLVTIEHAIYGNWLFTVGMGEMLAFPGMETP